MHDELFDFVVSGLRSRKGSWTQIAADTELSTKTLSRIVNGKGNNRRNTLKTLASYLEAQERGIAKSPQQ